MGGWFRRDIDAEKEIALWLHIAAVYDRYGAKAPENQRKEYFAVIMSCADGSQEHVLETVQLSTVTKEQAKEVINSFFHGLK
jgi:hypothetical protein